MNIDKKTAKIVGTLFLTVMVAYTIGSILLDPILNASDYLAKISANKNSVLIGVIFELMNGVAYIGIAVLVFPILKHFNEGMALGYASFRIIEFAMQIVSDIKALSLLSLSNEFVKAGASDVSSFKILGALLLSERYWANQMVFLTYALGAMIFYYVMYKLKLIPRFLSIWGLIGVTLVLINILLEIFGFNPGLILGAQMGLNEIVLGIWLIVKGFNPSVTVSRFQISELNVKIKSERSQLLCC